MRCARGSRPSLGGIGWRFPHMRHHGRGPPSVLRGHTYQYLKAFMRGVHTLIAKDTFEERIDRILRNKAVLAKRWWWQPK